MKKLFWVLLILLAHTSAALAAEEIKLDTTTIAKTQLNTPQTVAVSEDEMFDLNLYEDSSYNLLNNYNYDPNTQGQMRLWDGITQTARNVYNLQIENTDKPAYLLREPMTKYFESGPFESMHMGNVVILNNSEQMQDHAGGKDNFNVSLINTVIDGKFRGGNEDFQVLFDTTPTHSHKFFSLLLQDCFIRTHRIPHHTILIGNSRPAVGYEGSMSAFTIPFMARSQIARNFGTVRKFGARIIGNYSLVDYDLGGFSSDTYLSEFFPGVEFNGWVNIKPLGLTDGRFGKPVIGGGIVGGQRHAQDFFVASAYAGYEYKRAYIRAEYATSDGSNGGDGLTNKKRQGWCVTLGYKITKKLEFLLRYDEFDPNKMIANDHRREYTAGINYYIKGQALRLILNYVFCQNQNAKDSHRIVIGAQIAL